LTKRALPGVVCNCTGVRLRTTLRLMLRQFKHVPPHWEQLRTEVRSCSTLVATSHMDWRDESLPVASSSRTRSEDRCG